MNTRIRMSAAAFVGLFGLVGCAAGIESVPAAGQPGPNSESPPAASAAPTALDSGAPLSGGDMDGQPSTNGGETQGGTAGFTDAAALRAALASVAVPVDCPGGELVLDKMNQIVSIQTDCADLTISNLNQTVFARSVGALHMDASNSAVVVESADTVELSGLYNLVVWESGTPMVHDTGLYNVAVSSAGMSEALQGNGSSSGLGIGPNSANGGGVSAGPDGVSINVPGGPSISAGPDGGSMQIPGVGDISLGQGGANIDLGGSE